MPATAAQLAALQEFFGGAAGGGAGVAAGVSSAVKERVIGRVQVRLGPLSCKPAWLQQHAQPQARPARLKPGRSALAALLNMLSVTLPRSVHGCRHAGKLAS